MPSFDIVSEVNQIEVRNGLCRVCLIDVRENSDKKDQRVGAACYEKHEN